MSKISGKQEREITVEAIKMVVYYLSVSDTTSVNMSKDGDDCEGGDHLTLELQTNLREDYNYIITEKGLLLPLVST